MCSSAFDLPLLVSDRSHRRYEEWGILFENFLWKVFDRCVWHDGSQQLRKLDGHGRWNGSPPYSLSPHSESWVPFLFPKDKYSRQFCRLDIYSYVGWIEKILVVNSTNITTNIETAALSNLATDSNVHPFQLSSLLCPEVSRVFRPGANHPHDSSCLPADACPGW